MTSFYPSSEIQKTHQYIIKAWSFLPGGRTYTLKQAEKQARKIGKEQLIKVFIYISESNEINFRKVGRFLLRTSQFSHMGMRFAEVDRGNMKAWHLIPAEQEDTGPPVESRAETKRERYQPTKEEIWEAWRELPENDRGTSVKEALRLARDDPQRFPKLTALLSRIGRGNRARTLRNALKNASSHFDCFEHDIKVGPRRRLRRNVRKRCRPRVFIDPELCKLVTVKSYRPIG